MHLRSVTLKGFKSFPDRTRLEFAPGVSVVVGPNGSGKSNITDAVLWALGEQSPLAVRGQSMQDVIFAGGYGLQARPEAEVEVVLDNGDGTVDLPLSEISIQRRLDRTGDGEYRVNGARCRLADVLELLSDTGLGKEMHSVVSQGRVTSIVSSRPRERRLLIEEAAGLGKHRKRRRRAQLKLERTHDNLDRALDVEREARTRLKPLKRQAEAAELHERLERQTDEARWILARAAMRAAQASLSEAERGAAAARAAAAEAEQALAAVARRREAAEAALAARGAERETLSGRFHSARSAGERIVLRVEGVKQALAGLESRAARRAAGIEALEREAQADAVDEGADERIAALEGELEQLAAGREERLRRDLEELEERRAAAEAEAARLAVDARAGAAARRDAEEAVEHARAVRREAESAADRARREAARTGAELASVNQFLRARAGSPGGAPALADALAAAPGYELALAAALGTRMRAALAPDLSTATALLDRATKDGGAALVARPDPVADVEHGSPAAADPAGAVAAPGGVGGALPAPGAERLLEHVRAAGDPAAFALAAALLADVWVVHDVAAVGDDFPGVVVTREGRVWAPAQRELRQEVPGGEDRVLAERNRREELTGAVERAAQGESAAQAAVEAARTRLAEADRARDEADRSARTAARAHAEALDEERHARRRMDQRRGAPDEGEAAQRRTRAAAALQAERKLIERAEREREQRRARIAAERARLERERALAPRARALLGALEVAAEAIAGHVERFERRLREEREAGEQLAASLRACAAEEQRVQAGLKVRGEAVTRAEVAAQRARDAAADAGGVLAELAERLGLAAEPGDEPLADDERIALEGRIERLARRRAQLGPVNPLAQDEYAEALAHVEELESQREDLETAIRELQQLIRDTDRRIRDAFEETFAAASKNFEDVVGELFPGGRGRLRLVREDAGPRPVIGGSAADEAEPSEEERLEEAIDAAAEGDSDKPDDSLGVEIEITPAGKATKRLSLLSGGEKSMTALAFLFAVFLARPCPFYILDEVEAALDDLNIDRFLSLLRRVSGRAQFIVVTHQKRTMEAADCLYGVSMAGNGVSKVVSRRLPQPAAVPGPAEKPATAPGTAEKPAAAAGSAAA